MNLSIKPFRTAKVLGGLICLLAFFSLIGQVSKHFLGHGRLLGFVYQFSLGNEGNITTYVSTLLLLSASLLLGVVAWFAYQRQDSYRRHWAILAVIFAYLSVDEFAMLHEHLGTLTKEYLLAGEFFTYPWTVPGAVFLIAFAVGYARFFWHLSSRWKLLFAVSGLIYVGGAFGIEMIGGWYVVQHGQGTFTHVLFVTVEEVMEMSGVALFIYSLLEYVRDCKIEVRLTAGREQEPVPLA